MVSLLPAQRGGAVAGPGRGRCRAAGPRWLMKSKVPHPLVEKVDGGIKTFYCQTNVIIQTVPSIS